MFTKQNLLATLAGTLTMFVLGWAIWGFAIADFAEEHTLTSIMKDPPDMLFLVLSNLIGAFALSTIYGKWARGYHGAGQGFQFGVWIGIFSGISYSLLWYATAEYMDFTGHIVDGVVTLIYFAIVGAVIGLVYNAAGSKEEAA